LNTQSTCQPASQVDVAPAFPHFESLHTRWCGTYLPQRTHQNRYLRKRCKTGVDLAGTGARKQLASLASGTERLVKAVAVSLTQPSRRQRRHTF